MINVNENSAKRNNGSNPKANVIEPTTNDNIYTHRNDGGLNKIPSSAVLRHGHTGQLSGAPRFQGPHIVHEIFFGRVDNLLDLSLELTRIQICTEPLMFFSYRRKHSFTLKSVEESASQHNWLSLMCMENDILKTIDFKPIINELSALKFRKCLC